MNVWTSYTGNLKWLKDRTIFLGRHGSHAYGTNTPTSDLDVKGVCIPPREYLHGFVQRFEQADKGWQGVDCCIYEIRKYLGLAADCNPNLVEIVYLDEADWIESTPAWKTLVANRDLFLSKNAEHRFSGYAIAQLKRIHTHRRWLLNPPSHKPTRAEYKLPDHSAIPKEQREALESMMKKVVEDWQVDFAALDDPTRIDLLNKLAESLADMKLSADDQYVAAGNKLGLNCQAMEFLKAERAYRAALAEWTQYETWKRDRNPIRAETERQHGYDTKHAMHLVRLMRMAVEIAQGKGVLVRRPDAEELLGIRRGAWKFDDLMAWVERMKVEVPEAYKRSTLPKYPNRTKLDALCVEVVEESLR